MSRRYRKQTLKTGPIAAQTSQKLSCPQNTRSWKNLALLAVLIIAVCSTVLATHWPALSAKALSFDDAQYFTKNVLVQNPGWDSAKRFLTEILSTSTVQGYYQPLSMISLMFDYSLGGRENNLMPFHRTSLILHLINTSLMMVLLYLLFGNAWIAAAAGLIFGTHPMTVEPIPWVGERKTLLAAFFSLWSLIFYVYSRTTRRQLSATIFFVSSFFMYLLALMSKPTSTPLPAVMLLMDYWPLNRLRWQAVMEKLPFFILGGVSSVVTYISQNATAGTVSPAELGLTKVPLIFCYSVTFYLSKIFVPINLSSHYAFPDPLSLTNPAVFAGVLGTCILIAALVFSFRRTPAVLTGFLIFLIAILPAMQMLRFSDVVAADKFTYLPSIGLLMILAFFLRWLVKIGNPQKTVIRSIAIAAVILLLAGTEAVATRRYLHCWRESIGLFEHMFSLTPNSPIVCYNFGNALSDQNKIDEAMEFYRRALKIRPDFADARNNLGTMYETQGKIPEAINNYLQAQKLKPDSPQIYYNLAHAFQALGDTNRAVSYYRQAISLKSDYADAQNNLGMLLQSLGKLDESTDCLIKSIQANPNYAESYNNLGINMGMQSRYDQAVKYFQKALQVKPDFFEAHCNLGNAYRAQNRFDEAVTQFRLALKLKPDFPEAHGNLATTLQALGKNDEALKHFREAIRLRPDWPMPFNYAAKILSGRPDPNTADIAQAIAYAEKAVELTSHKDAEPLGTLAACYAAAGQFDKAAKTAQTALELAVIDKKDKLITELSQHLDLYKQGKR